MIDLDVVRANRPPEPLHLPGGFGHQTRGVTPLHHHIAKERVIQPADGAALPVVFRFIDFFVVHDRSGQQAGILQNPDDLGTALVCGPIFNGLVDFDLGRGADAFLVSFITVEHIRLLDDVAQGLEVGIRKGAEHDIAGFELLLGIDGIREVGLTGHDDAVDAELGVPVAPALPDDTKVAVQRGGVGAAAGGSLHLGEFDHGAQAGFLPPDQGRQCRHGDLGAGVPVDDPVGGFGGMAAKVLVSPGDGGQAGVGLTQNIIGAAENLGAITETATPDIDKSRVKFLQMPIALFPFVKGAVAVALGQAVALPHQVVENRL